MFNMNKIGKIIKDARTKKNMTQLELADKMGVSYQAVSNWERGNSMPDIAKIPDLTKELGLELSELFDGENGQFAAETVTKTISEPDAVLSPEELAEVAPILPPKELKEKTEKTVGKDKVDLSALIPLAPYLDDEYLDELISGTDVSDMTGLVELAPYLSDEALDDITDRLLEAGKAPNLIEIVFYLTDESIHKIADYLLHNKDIEGLSKIKDYL